MQGRKRLRREAVREEARKKRRNGGRRKETVSKEGRICGGDKD